MFKKALGSSLLTFGSAVAAMPSSPWLTALGVAMAFVGSAILFTIEEDEK